MSKEEKTVTTNSEGKIFGQATEPTTEAQKPEEPKAPENKTLRYEIDPVIREKIPDGYHLQVKGYTNILTAAATYTDTDTLYNYMVEPIRELKENNVRMSWLYHYAVVYLKKICSKKDVENLRHAIQSTLDEYSENRNLIVQLINLLHTKSKYPTDRIKKLFLDTVEEISETVGSLSRTLEVEIDDL